MELSNYMSTVDTGTYTVTSNAGGAGNILHDFTESSVAGINEAPIKELVDRLYGLMHGVHVKKNAERKAAKAKAIDNCGKALTGDARKISDWIMANYNTLVYEGMIYHLHPELKNSVKDELPANSKLRGIIADELRKIRQSDVRDLVQIEQKLKEALANMFEL